MGFFGKFILCSNNEDNFIKIDSEETLLGLVSSLLKHSEIVKC